MYKSYLTYMGFHFMVQSKEELINNIIEEIVVHSSKVLGFQGFNCFNPYSHSPLADTSNHPQMIFHMCSFQCSTIIERPTV
jgi:hypothetical protein